MPIDKKLYHPEFKKHSQACLEQANYLCQECGIRQGTERISKRGKAFKEQIHAHHITAVRKKIEPLALQGENASSRFRERIKTPANRCILTALSRMVKSRFLSARSSLSILADSSNTVL